MPDVVAIRMEWEFLKKIDSLSKEESEDRSTIIRKLIRTGYRELLKEKSARRYIQGKITLSEAAHTAELTILEMEHYLVDQGFKSEYSIEDLERELATLE